MDSGLIPTSVGMPQSLFLMTNTLETGGSERQFATVARALASEQFSVRLGCLRKYGPFAEGLDGLTEFSPQGSLFGWKSQSARWALGRYLRANGVVVAHSFDFYSNFMLIPSARLARIPVVIGSQRQIGDLLSGFRNTAQHVMFRWCDRIVCNSRAAARGLENNGINSRKVVVIPNALPNAVFASRVPARPPGRVRVVMVARMNDPAKCHDVFLKAAARIVSSDHDVEFVLVGDGPLRQGIEAMASNLGLKERLIVMGDRRDVPAVLASCDISVLTSSSESLSNAIMESMAAGLPVVACRVGGNDELIRDGENGFLATAGNDEEIAHRIVMLLRQPELRKKLGAAAQRDAQKFSVDDVCKQYINLYSSLLEEKGIESQPSLQSVV
jgi:L-malate glycosyltransferase